MGTLFATAKAQAALMGCAFLLAFAAYDTIQVYAKRLYPGDLGSNMTMAIYIAFVFAELFAPAVVNKVGPRLSMGVGICGYASVVVAGLIFFETGQSPAIVLLAGCILGVGAALLWTGQGRLILEYSVAADRGILFGIFWALYRMASVLGGLLSFTYFSLNSAGSGSVGLYIIFLALVLSGALATLMLKDPADIHREDVTRQSFESIGAPGVDSVEAPLTWIDEVKATFHAFRSPVLLTLALMFWTSGGNEPFILSGFTDRWFEKRDTGLEMVFYFSCSIIGALTTGRTLDGFSARRRERFGAYVVLFLASLVHLTAFACAAVVETSSYWDRRYMFSDVQIMLPTVAFVLWGLSDAMINSFLYWLIGVLFSSGGERSRAIGFFKLLNSAAHVVGYAILPVHRVTARTQLAYNVVAYIAGALLAAVAVARVGAGKVPSGRDLTADIGTNNNDF